MGTSSSYHGPKTGLIPSWLGGDGVGGNSGDDTGDNAPDAAPADGQDGPDQSDPVFPPAQPEAMPPARQSYTGSKSNYTRFTNSGNRKALGRALKGYVANSGGSTGAAQRMGSSTRVASGLAGFVNTFSSSGPAEALSRFDLLSFAGRPAIEVLEALTDKLCPDGGTIDEAIARDAMLEALAAFSAEDLGDFETLTAEQLGDFLTDVITRSIVTKVVNDIGFGSLHGSASDADFQQAQAILHDYTAEAVRDALGGRFSSSQSMTGSEITDQVNAVYGDAYGVLEIILEDMS